VKLVCDVLQMSSPVFGNVCMFYSAVCLESKAVTVFSREFQVWEQCSGKLVPRK